MRENHSDEVPKKRNRSVRSTTKKEIAQFNKQEARGWVVERLNYIEERINIIISAYFKPEKWNEFVTIVMNNSIIGFGAKLKILRNITGFDIKIIEDLRKLSAIRNGFAHVVDDTIYEYEEQAKTFKDIYDVIEVMDSSGLIKQKEFRAYLTEFDSLFIKIQKYLIDYRMKTRGPAVKIDLTKKPFKLQ
jgi:hypothetical protein